MDSDELFRVVQRFAHGQVSRRAALRASGLGLSAAMLQRMGIAAASDTPGNGLRRATAARAAQSTPSSCPTGSPTDFEIDGGWLCRQKYALCTQAPCEPDANDATIANCRCLVEDGYSMGYTSCEERKPTGTKLVSTFSTENVTSEFHVMNCPAEARWTNCVDVSCEIDPDNPNEAVCPCPIVETGPSFTFGGDCDTSTCTSVIWSGAAPPGVTQYATAMACINQPVTFPETCPGATPGAAAAGTPATT